MAENVKDLHIIKRSGAEVPFDGKKIINAIKGANKEVDSMNRISDNDIESIETKIYADLMELPYEVDVEQIQDMVELGLMKHDAYKVAQKYIRYRYEHELQRSGSNLDAGILALIDFESETIKQENSNKNPMINSTQRDYMAGEVSKDITLRKLLPRDIVEAHNEGILQFHDSDYFAQHMTNCLHRNTKFCTRKGIRTFEACQDGEKVTVLDKDGIWREATVHSYGEQSLQVVTLISSDGYTTDVICTANHRWVLSSGNVTEDLKVGDTLYSLKGREELIWTVKDIKSYNDGKPETVWCVDEPVTHTFTLDGPVVTGNCTVFNLEDMLQNGTMISETLIEKPKSFSVACNVSTQIIAQVASNQYGGQTFSLAHLAPFVDVSRKKLREKVIQERIENGESLDDVIVDKITERRLRDEVKDGVQTIQYQILTLLTTNGLFGELAVVKLRELFVQEV